MFAKVFTFVTVFSVWWGCRAGATEGVRRDDETLVIAEENIPLKLHNLVDLALERNNVTKQAYLKVKIAQDQLKIGKANYYPTLGLEAGYAEKDGDSYNHKIKSLGGSLNLNYTLFAFGKYRANVKLVQHYLERIKYEQNKAVQDVIYQVVNSYYELLLLKAQKEAKIEAENLSLETYKAASLKYKLGIVPLVDKLKSNNSYSENKLGSIRAENNIRKQEGVLNNILNLEPGYVLHVETPEVTIEKIERDVNYFLKEAKEYRIELRTLQEEKNEKIQELKALKASLYPEISLNGALSNSKNLSANDSKNYVDTSISLNVRVPLFAGFGNVTSIRAKEKEIEYMDLQIKQMEKDISNEVWEAYHDFSTNQVSFFIADDLLKTATENAKVNLGMYKNGKASMLAVLDSQSQLENAKVEFINSKYNWLIYRVKLLKVTGKMSLDNIININKL
ncbi:MAG: TolC family protein [Rickettsiales bacterium]|jgi:outer membrane protein|nr:TolC family protein [Rickettsiales bacterium]